MGGGGKSGKNRPSKPERKRESKTSAKQESDSESATGGGNNGGGSSKGLGSGLQRRSRSLGKIAGSLIGYAGAGLSSVFHGGERRLNRGGSRGSSASSSRSQSPTPAGAAVGSGAPPYSRARSGLLLLRNRAAFALRSFC